MAAKLRQKNRTTCRAISDTTILQRGDDGSETIIATIPRRRSNASARKVTRSYVSPDATPELTPERALILAELAKSRERAANSYDVQHREVY